MALCFKTSQLTPLALSSLRGMLLSTSFIPVRGLISLPIEWKRPDRLPFDHPIKTGDGTTQLKVDMTKAPVVVERSKEYENANELVKRMFTFHFVGRKYAMRRATDEMAESVRNHNYDNNSTEVQIAKKTARIRNLMEHMKHSPSDKIAKTHLNDCIHQRRRRIRLLRRFDYKRYEWLLEKLDLIYTPVPEELFYVQRKDSIRRLANQYCEDYKQRKLNEYKELLERKRADFLREKVETLKWARQEEIDCGVKPTISEADIQEAVDKLEKHLQELKLKPVLEDVSRNILSDV